MLDNTCQIDENLNRFIGESEQLRQYRLAKQQLIKALECKICKEIPRGLIMLLSCCGQIIGCQRCLSLCLRENSVCPLCRAENPTSIQVNVLESVFNFFSEI